MLSLSSSQLSKLQKIQHADSDEQDPLYFSRDFRKSLDFIQEQLFSESKIWRFPRCQYITKSEQEHRIDRRENREREDTFFYSIKLSHLIIPELRDRLALRKQQAADQHIYKLLQRASAFIKSLQPSQTRIFQNVMICNFTLRYFFISIQPDQL